MARWIHWNWFALVFVVVILELRNLTSLEISPLEDLVYSFSPNVSAKKTMTSSASVDREVSNWASAIDKSTEILYRDSSREERLFWLSQPPPTVYIYDNIPAAFSDVATVSTCVDTTFLGRNFTEVWVESQQNCRWRPQVCEDSVSPTRPKQQKFFSYRQNYNMDVAYLDKFLRYPFQTTDPSKADIFVVPYPHKSHCLCHQDFQKFSAACAVPFDDMKDNVLDRLNFMKNTSLRSAKGRHLFFHGADWLQQNRMFRDATSGSMSLSLGPVSTCTLEGPCGDVSLPYVSTDLDYQPFMSTTPSEDPLGSSILDRKYFLGAALGSPRGLPQRSQFLKDWKFWTGDSIGGKPNHVLNIGTKRTSEVSRVFKDLYRNSTVCLVVGLPSTCCLFHRLYCAPNFSLHCMT